MTTARSVDERRRVVRVLVRVLVESIEAIALAAVIVTVGKRRSKRRRTSKRRRRSNRRRRRRKRRNTTSQSLQSWPGKQSIPHHRTFVVLGRHTAKRFPSFLVTVLVNGTTIITIVAVTVTATARAAFPVQRQRCRQFQFFQIIAYFFMTAFYRTCRYRCRCILRS